MLKDFIETCINNNIPFVSYRKPNSNKIITCIQETEKVLNSYDISEFEGSDGFIFVPFDVTNEKSYLLVPDIVIDDYDNNYLERINNLSFPKKTINSIEEGSTLRNDYDNQFYSLMSDFKDGLLDKAILSRVICKKSDNKPFHYFEQLLNNRKESFVYIINIPDENLWIGATPEQFVNLSNNRIRTTALAGTRSVNDDWSEKEIKEQKYVQDYIRMVFDKFSIPDVKSNTDYSSGIGNIKHIRTEFTAIIDKSGNDIFELLKELHPTPAVCGTPKSESFQRILKLEKHNRKYYCGFLGRITNNYEFDLYVNLRCMQITSENIQYYLGGGLTKDSDVDSEWNETVMKYKSIAG